MEVEEVNDVSRKQAVPQIARCAPQDQGQADRCCSERMTVAPQDHRHDRQGDQGEQYQRSCLPVHVGIGEQSKGGAGIFDVGEVEKAGNDGHTVMQGDVASHCPLGYAVESDDRDGDQQEVLTHMSILRRTTVPERS